MSIPVIGFAAYSGTGKTTVLEKLIRELTARGLRVGTVKHDGHDFEIDHPGKDSYRHIQAGAQTTVITSPEKTAVIIQQGETLEQCIAQITDDDSVQTKKPRFSLEDTRGLADFIMKEISNMQSGDFTHFNDQGRARMVDVGEKAPTHRTATAAGRVLVNESTFSLIRSGGMKKGDVLTVAQIAGIMAAKHTPDWIPMCHPVPLNGIDLRLWLDESRLSVEIEATAKCDGKTGVEMEALTAVSGAALTVYDMCKAVQRDMVIDQIRLISKTGGVHGDYQREEET